VINLKTAKTLGLAMQLRADEVIEQRCFLLQRVRTRLALNGHIEASSRRPLL